MLPICSLQLFANLLHIMMIAQLVSLGFLVLIYLQMLKLSNLECSLYVKWYGLCFFSSSTGSSDAPNISCSTNVAIAAVVSCAVSFIIAALVGAVIHYCTVRKKCDCQKFYSLTIARKKQQQQLAPVYDDMVGQSQNIEVMENVAYGPVQQ